MMTRSHKYAIGFIFIDIFAFFMVYLMILASLKAVVSGRWGPMQAKEMMMLAAVCCYACVTFVVPLMMAPQDFRVKRYALLRASTVSVAVLCTCGYYLLKNWINVDPQVLLVDLNPLVDLFTPLCVVLLPLAASALALGLLMIYQVEPSPSVPKSD